MNEISAMSNCHFCEEGVLSRQTKNTEYKYKGRSQLLPQPGFYCDSCDGAILEPSDLKYNRIQLQSFKSKVDGLLLPQEVKKNRNSLDLKRGEALGFHRNTVVDLIKRGAIVVDGVVYAPVKKRKKGGDNG